MNDHPSSFAVDLLRLDAGDDATREHVVACASCRAYFDALAPLSPTPRLWPRAVAGLSALAACALVLVSLSEGPDIRSKAAPAVAVYVKHGERVLAWDGRAPLAVNDALRLEVARVGHAFVQVLSAGGQTLYRGALRAEREALPLSFVVDAEGREETLFVILSRTALDDRAALAAVNVLRRDGEVWTIRLHFDKGAP